MKTTQPKISTPAAAQPTNTTAPFFQPEASRKDFLGSSSGQAPFFPLSPHRIQLNPDECDLPKMGSEKFAIEVEGLKGKGQITPAEATKLLEDYGTSREVSRCVRAHKIHELKTKGNTTPGTGAAIKPPSQPSATKPVKSVPAPRIKVSAAPAATPSAGAPTLTVDNLHEISVAVADTLYDYQNLLIYLPDNKGYVEVSARYWMGGRGREKTIPKHDSIMDHLRKDLKAHIKEGEPNLSAAEIDTEETRITVAVKYGKATPSQLEGFIETAMEKAYKQFQASGKVKWDLPQIGDDSNQWKDRIQEWINKYEIGIDCSGFVFEALRQAHRNIGGEEAENAFADKFRNDSGQIDHPASYELTTGKHATPVSSPGELRAGDLMQMKRGSDRHIRIIHSVEKIPNGSGKTSIEFTTMESSSAEEKLDIAEGEKRKTAFGSMEKKWKFPDADKFEGLQLEKLSAKGGYVWEKAKRRDRRFKYFHPKFHI